MAYFEWDNDYTVGIKTMDNQHKNLIDIINKLHSSMSSDFDNEVLQSAMSELEYYAAYHFTVEEGIMRHNDFPELSSHIEEHKKYIQALQNIRLQIVERKSESMIIIKLEDFLRKWWVNHIINLDKKYGSYITSKDIVRFE